MVTACPVWKKHDDAMWKDAYSGVPGMRNKFCGCGFCRRVYNLLWDLFEASKLPEAGTPTDIASAMDVAARVFEAVLDHDIKNRDGVFRAEYAFVATPTDFFKASDGVQVAMCAPLAIAPRIVAAGGAGDPSALWLDVAKPLREVCCSPQQAAHRRRTAEGGEDTTAKTSFMKQLPPMVTLRIRGVFAEGQRGPVRIPTELWTTAGGPCGRLKNITHKKPRGKCCNYQLSAVVVADTAPGFALRCYKCVDLSHHGVPWLCHDDDGNIRPTTQDEATTFVLPATQPVLVVYAISSFWKP